MKWAVVGPIAHSPKRPTLTGPLKVRVDASSSDAVGVALTDRHGGASVSVGDRARGDALYELKKYDALISAFKKAEKKLGPGHLMDTHHDQRARTVGQKGKGSLRGGRGHREILV